MLSVFTPVLGNQNRDGKYIQQRKYRRRGQRVYVSVEFGSGKLANNMFVFFGNEKVGKGASRVSRDLLFVKLIGQRRAPGYLHFLKYMECTAPLLSVEKLLACILFDALGMTKGII